MGKKFRTEKDPETGLLRVIACKDLYDIKKGEKGGLIEKEENLSQEGNCWIYKRARVFGDAVISGDAVIFDGCVSGNAKVLGKVRVGGKVRISENVKLWSTLYIYINASIENNKDYVMLTTKKRKIVVFSTERTYLSKILSEMKDNDNIAVTTTALDYINNIQTIRQLYEKEI